VASSITVIDSAEIARSNKTNVLDLLKDQYGVSVVQSGGPGQLAQLNMRGAAASDVLVMIDGVRLNNPDASDNSYDFSSLPVDNIERIEILRGPQSTLYGSDAMAGVINIITKKGNGTPSYFFNLEGGSLNSFKGLAGAGGSYGQADYSVTFSKTGTDGIPAADIVYGNTHPDGYYNYNISSRFGWTISPDIKFNTYANFNSGKVGLDLDGGPYANDPTFEADHEQGEYKAEANITGFHGLWQQDLSISFVRNLTKYNDDSTLYNPQSSTSFYQGDIYQLEWQNNLKTLKSQIITFGFSAENDNSSSAYQSLSSILGNYFDVSPQKHMNAFSGYFQDQIKISGNVFTTAGIRYDNYGNLGSALTYRIAQTYLIEKTGTKLKGVYGTGFKAPSLYDLYDPNYGNPALKSEYSSGWEAGFEQYLFNYDILFGVTYFNNNFWNLLGYNPVTYQSININSAQSNGIESYITALIGKAIKLNATYTYTNNIDRSPADNNEYFLLKPKNSGSITLNYIFINDEDLNIDVIFVGKRSAAEDVYDPAYYYFAAGPVVRLGAYTLLNITDTHKISDNLQLYERIENALDKRYEEVWGYGTPGITVNVGLKINIK
jgi:vitamin B12 transporter